MADSAPTGFRSRSYRRLCDVCGNLRPIEELHRQDDLWVCTYDAGERVRTQLDRLNARERPFTIKPVPHPKPQNPYYPNTLEADDAAVFNFLAQQIASRARYELVTSGASAYTAFTNTVPAMAWAGRYFYDLIQANDRRADLISGARTQLNTIAIYLLSRQYGTTTGPSPTSTRATEAFFGGILDSGTTVFVTEDVAASGLALLYAYRIFGTTSYLQGARDAASYLRNVQAIGSNGTNFTSSDSAGTARLYTGSLASMVSTTAGFFSTHLFYSSALLALEFWNELKTTDGDQSVGATAAVAGFTTTPSQLLSDSIADLRDCWSNGITDSTGVTLNGLSTTYPRENFNAYPASKSQFSYITGTGQWEYANGPAATGTAVSSQTFARALSALYNYEGATEQVTTISDWLRGFTSNLDFESADGEGATELYNSTAGSYDATLSLSTLLKVRDEDAEYSAISMNGSSLYDWGAFGLMSRIWANRNKASFLLSRLVPLGSFQRFFNGTATDVSTDRAILRSQSGMSMQGGFGAVPQTGDTVAFPPGRMGRGTDLEFDSAFINVPTGELTTRGYWRFTSIDDTDGALFPFADDKGEIGDGQGIVLFNAAGSAVFFFHLAAEATSTELPYSLVNGAILQLSVGFAIQFVRDETIEAWRQVGYPFPLPSSGAASPIVMVNDAVGAAQFGRTFREARS